MAADTDWAWAAGVFDGEGCTWFGAAKKNKDGYTRSATLMLGVTQKDRRLLDRLQTVAYILCLILPPRRVRLAR